VRVLAAALGVLIATGADVTSSAQGPFRADVRVVTVTVSVRQNGRPVPSLAAHDFEVRDAGHLQSIAEVSSGRMPLDVMFVVDLSGSITMPLLASLSAAVDAVRDRLGDEDRVGLLTFNHRIREAQPLVSQAPSFRHLFGTADGSTSLTDAITSALLAPPDVDRRRLIVVFSDGRDTTSFTEGRALVDIAKRRDAAIFTVALAGGSQPAGLTDRSGLFGLLAATTGGEVVVIRRHDEVGSSFLRAVEEFRSSYVLRYSYEGPPLPGWHDLAVKVLPSARFDVRARNGYEVRP
jgi:VWFA-related protein